MFENILKRLGWIKVSNIFFAPSCKNFHHGLLAMGDFKILILKVLLLGTKQ